MSDAGAGGAAAGGTASNADGRAVALPAAARGFRPARHGAAAGAARPATGERRRGRCGAGARRRWRGLRRRGAGAGAGRADGTAALRRADPRRHGRTRATSVSRKPADPRHRRARPGGGRGGQRTGLERAARTGVRVEQSWGDVFYRVDPGANLPGPHAGGEVEVTGTCFRVALEAAGRRPGRAQHAGGGVRGRRARTQWHRTRSSLRGRASGPAWRRGASRCAWIASRCREPEPRAGAAQQPGRAARPRTRQPHPHRWNWRPGCASWSELRANAPAATASSADGPTDCPRAARLDFTPEERQALARAACFAGRCPGT